ncbi:MAG TPA: acyl-CoA dehydrogenase [Verrucomicrobiae bacterium]|nr:acyl-CoA dehydrogenase [Verrucomicrobiae bacterium]
MTYTAPVRDMLFTLDTVAGIGDLARLPVYHEVTPDLTATVLEQAGRFAGEVLAPLNRTGDIQGSRLENGVVRTPDGFADAYRQFCDGGWNGLPFDPAFGGQGLPWVLGSAVQEMWDGANMAFGLCPLLTKAAVDALHSFGTPAQKAKYLAPLVHGRWSGTMNLTEPQAGSDVGALRSRAVKNGEHYRLTGQKIFITYGDHDMSENIVHMVLARTPDAPPGVKGLSLFIVPKIMVGADGKLGARNDIRTVSLEHKMGINGSPTAILAYGDDSGAFAELVGEENRGIEYMFAMMNNARLSIGIEGLGIAERAYQMARDYARQRVQSRAVDSADHQPVPIIRHPDVRRMLMTMRANVDAMRAIIYYTAAAIDRAKHLPDSGDRAQWLGEAELLTPVAKAWCTDTACQITSLAVQVHGGLGYIEQTGVAQLYRDARIAPIYEGTNGIQANDLVGRKLMRDGGASARAFFAQVRAVADAASGGGSLPQIGSALGQGLEALEQATHWLIDTWPTDKRLALSGASPYLQLFGLVTGAFLLARQAEAAQARRNGADRAFLDGKVTAARFFCDNLLPAAAGLATAVTAGGPSTLELPEELF